MNEEPPTPPDAGNDGSVEARIVSWVLGEASAFEAAELERLCEERPELLVFRRRMRELHGLLTESEASEPDLSWKLPEEKRRILDDIFGEEKIPPAASSPEAGRVRRNGLRVLSAIAACVAISLFVIRLEPWKHESAVARAYQSDRAEKAAREAEKEMAALTKAIRDQEDVVEDNRKLLATISKTKGIIYRGQDSYYGTGEAEEKSARDALETYNQVRKDKMQLESQIDSLRRIDSDQLMVTAAGLDLPDNAIKSDYPKYMEAQRDLEALKLSGLGSDHPDMKAAEEQVHAMKTRMDEGVAKIKESLETKLDIAANTLKNAEMTKNTVGEEAINRGLSGHDYVDAKRELESSQRLLESMKLRKTVAEATLKMSHDAITIHGESELLAKSEKPDTGSQPAVSPGTGMTLNLNTTARYEQRAKRSGPQDPATPAVPDSLALPQIAGSKERESPPVDAFTDSAGTDLAHVPPAGRSGAGSQMESLADDSVSPGVVDSFAPAQSAETRSGTKSGAASVPAVLSSRQPINPASPEPAKKSSDLVQKEVIRDFEAAQTTAREIGLTAERQKNVDGLGSDLYNVGGSHNDVTYDDDTSPPIGGVSQGDLEALKRMYGTVETTAGHTQETNYPLSEIGRNSVIAGELAEDAGDLRPAEPAAPSEADSSSGPPIEETPAAENPYSTFSLNINDASFQLAKAALAKGERPDPAGIKPEQFYNAVDYGDPAPSANEPVSAVIEQAAHPFIPGRNLVRVAVRTGSTGRSAAQPLRLTLLVDQSGSMVRDDRRAAMEQALAQLGSLLTKADLVTVIGFSRTPRLLADGMAGDQAAELGKLVNQTASEGGTNLEEAMKLGAQLATRHQLAGAQNRIVLFTDGAANLGDAKPERLAEQVKVLRQKGIAFDIAGIGADGLNDRLLSELARNGNGRYYVVGGESNSFARQLAGAFRPAAENVKIQVIFNPQRVGRYKLIGFEKDRLKTEDFRNDSVDAAELAADEAGVAIYQVEPLAEGRGEIGEISVRFRDTNSGEMVERGWTLPYDTKASAFDRATPSMQLAGLSMLAAEKLRGGPLATAIDFNQLSGSAAFVRQFYGSAPRVTEMLRVIEALK
ncbi:von Willebrand factor type A domain-containing protein [Luteolibacter yonseiensis]|uniref:von Willebrand factor type A domain-containing protein n=1 Tax=Luteolibacter yonseiensis TaxID=1144680 RepID=A0A934V911_9BACT|nr:von Willebrand factor type A domain-containing protein [Luteolibacter yonseiensis]MBK1817822.1 von Willebrand factor type A domain-containing protein [Luteolibacter yonseiensis]